MSCSLTTPFADYVCTRCPLAFAGLAKVAFNCYWTFFLTVQKVTEDILNTNWSKKDHIKNGYWIDVEDVGRFESNLKPPPSSDNPVDVYLAPPVFVSSGRWAEASTVLQLYYL